MTTNGIHLNLPLELSNPPGPPQCTLVAAWREMLDTWKRQKTAPSYQFDTPLPPTANPGTTHAAARRVQPNSLAQSIGELAPAGL